MTLPRGRWLLLILLAVAAPATAQVTPDQQAEMAVNAANKAYADGNLPAAREMYKQFLTKFGNDRRATAARLGLGLCAMHAPEQDFAAAVEPLTQAANDGGFADRGSVLYHLALCQRALGLKEKAKPPADQKFADAARRFQEARDWYAGKKDDDRAARCRADQADAELRAGRVKEARQTTEPFTKDAALAKNPNRPLGLYYHGLACFLDRDYPAAGKTLNQLAPFADPAYGPHARYLVGRVLHLNAEAAEAGVHYDGVLADFEKLKKDAVAQLQQPDKFKTNPAEKARLETLAKGPVPEFIAGATFHGASLGYEGGKFAEALGKFQAFARDHAAHPFAADANLRVGFCFVQLKQFDEAIKLLAPLAEKDPRLQDQALFWIGKAQVGVALAADPANPADREAKLRAAKETLLRAAARAGQVEQQDPDARGRRGEALVELGDALLLAKQPQPAAQAFMTVWNEKLLPERRHEEVAQRLAQAYGVLGDHGQSDQWCEEFRKKFPQSTLAAAVAFRSAENAYARAVAFPPDANRAEERRQRYDAAGKKFQEVVEKYPEFERASYARYGVGVCLAQNGDLEAAAKALDAIPAPDRAGELAPAAYLLADCLIRLAPAKADDALAENIIREKLTAASGLLENYAASNPKAADAPDALLKLGFCLKRLGSTLADANERNQLLNKSREFYEKLAKDYPQAPQAGHARLEIAKVRALMGDRGGAMNDLRQFNGPLEKSPVAPLALLQLATLHREQNQPAEAAKVLEDARKKYDGPLAQDKERAEWAFLLKYHHGVALAEMQKPADAAKLFEEVVQQGRGKVIGAEAALRAGQTRIAAAKAEAERGRQERAKPNLKPDQIAAADKIVNDARGSAAQAATRLEQWCSEFAQAMPNSEPRARMLYDAAWAYRGLAEADVAKAWDALKKDAKAAAVPRAKVPVQHYEDRAFHAYKRLADEFPELALAVDARFELAELRAERDEHDVAIKLLKEALDKEPTDRSAPPELLERVRLRLGGCLFAKKDYPAALSQFDAVAANEKSPYKPQAVYRAGECLFAAGDFAKAAERLTPFRDRGEWHNVAGVSDRAVLRLGQAHAAAKNWEPARQSFDAMLARYGNSPFAADARYGLGWALQAQGKYDEAVGQYDQVTKLTTAEVAAKAQTQVGLCRLAQKKYAEAAAALMAVPYTYDFPEIGYAAVLEAARAFAEDKKPEQAEKLLRKLLADAPPNSEWAKAAAERLKK